MFRKLFAVFAFALICNTAAEAYITIGIERDELQHLGEIFVQAYIEQSVILSTRRIRPQCIKDFKTISDNLDVIITHAGKLVEMIQIHGFLQRLKPT